MATPDVYLSPVDIKDSHILTRAVERKAKEPSVYSVPFAPLTSTTARKIKLRVRASKGSGLASFKADNALTPVISTQGELIEIFMELALISEKDVLKPSDLIALQSPDELIAQAAAKDVLDKAVVLRQRNINRTKWMAWQAAFDNLSITYPDGTSIAVDYDLDGDAYNDWFSTSHLPTTSIAWSTTATATIIDDVYLWSKIIADDLGVDQSEVIMYCRTSAWRNMQKNTGIRGELSPSDPRVITPKRDEVVEILGIGEIRINNEFYTEEGSETKNYFLDEGHILLTGPDSVNGAPLMEMKDGPVVRVSGNNDLVVSTNPGAVSEVYVNQELTVQNVRVSTARLPQMNYPAGFVYADISP